MKIKKQKKQKNRDNNFQFCISANATSLEIGMDVTSTPEINFPNFQCWEIKEAWNLLWCHLKLHRYTLTLDSGKKGH